MKLIFDATRLKYPNTGLYHFTLQLAQALERIAPRYNCQIEYLVYDTVPELESSRQRTVKPWHKLLSMSAKGAAITHTPYQHYRYKKAQGTKQILTIHDLNFMVEKSPQKQQKYLQKLQNQINSADTVVAISHYAKQDIEKHCNLGGKEITVIHNGCNVNHHPVTVPPVAPESGFIFGIGTILPKKNWHTLPALLVGNALELIIAGQHSDYCARIMQEAVEYGVEGRVHLVGTIGEGEKAWYLANCKAFVFPSIAEGFGLPVIEAMAQGKRVFCSPHCSLPEVAGDSAHYFPHDFNTQDMQSLFNNVMAQEMTETEKNRAIERAQSFNWDTAAQQYFELYTNTPIII